jgi:hypothetical protein
VFAGNFFHQHENISKNSNGASKPRLEINKAVPSQNQLSYERKPQKDDLFAIANVVIHFNFTNTNK